jgi:hypothetical protein
MSEVTHCSRGLRLIKKKTRGLRGTPSGDVVKD